MTLDDGRRSKKSSEVERPSSGAIGPLSSLIKKVIPGASPAVKTLREETLEFCADPLARSILLRGPIGSGKSSLARLLAFGKCIAPMKEREGQIRIDDLRFEAPGQIDQKSMSWYVELTLTGLVNELADSQLFGMAPSTATGVRARPGIFEMAQHGRGGDDAGSDITGGVVFLDEIADLAHNLQAKLLPALSGQPVYRVGGEGSRNYEIEFEGVVIAASWRVLQDETLVRPDLLSRISASVIDVPGLEDRKEDLPQIINGIQNALIDHYERRIEEMIRAGGSEIDSSYLNEKKDRVHTLDERACAELASVNWSLHGNFRGLTNAIEKIVFRGHKISEVVSQLPTVTWSRQAHVSDPQALVRSILERKQEGGGFIAQVKSIELERRRAVQTYLLSNPTELAELSHKLEMDEQTLRTQVQQLARSRRQHSPIKGYGR